ncbi:MAG: hypothetical protein V4717_15415 [Bacteroidota bacterium]
MKIAYILIAMLAITTLCSDGVYAQNVGIGTTSPTAPLSFGSVNNAYFQKMVFYKNEQYPWPAAGLGTNGTSMAFSMLGGVTNSIAFGYGRSDAFNETMRVNYLGNVGIGVKDPQNRLDVGNRMRIRWQNGVIAPGFQFRCYFPDLGGNVYQNYYLGMMDDNSVAMLSGGTTIFRYWANNGALSLNGTDGFAGQVLVSNGPNATPSWKYMTHQDIYNYTTDFFEPNAYSLTDKAPVAELVSFNRAIDLPRTSKVSLDYSIPVSTSSCAFCGPTDFDVEVKLAGTTVFRKKFTLLNGRMSTVTGSVILNLNHSDVISIVVIKKSGPTLAIPAAAGRLANLVLWVIPQL